MRVAAIARGFMGTALAGMALATLPLDQAAGAAPPHPQLRSIIMLAKPRHRPNEAMRIAAWIHDLSSQRYTTREHAQKHLIAAGDAAVPALSDMLHVARTPQVQTDISTALLAIQRADARRGPLVTLRAAKMPVPDIIRRICQQAGIRAKFYPAVNHCHRRLSVNVRRRPFWNVLRRIAAVTGISPTRSGYGNSKSPLQFGPHGLFEKGAPVFTDGRVAIVVESLHLYHSRQFAAAAMLSPSRSLQVRMVVLWCPVHTQWVYSLSATVSAAVDDRAKVLVSAAKPSQSGAWSDTGATEDVFPCEIGLGWPTAGAKVIKTLQGHVSVVMSLGWRTYKVTNLQSGRARLKCGDMLLSFGKPKRAAGHWDVGLSIRSPRTSLIASAFSNHVLGGHTIQFYTASSRKLALGGNGLISEGGLIRTAWRKGCDIDYYSLHLTGGRPATALIRFHGQLAHLRFPFMFRNVPIPQ